MLVKNFAYHVRLSVEVEHIHCIYWWDGAQPLNEWLTISMPVFMFSI